MRKEIVAALGFLLVSACSNAAAPSEEVQVNGTWHGEGTNYYGRTIQFDMTLDGTSLPRQGTATMDDGFGHRVANWDIRARTTGDSVYVYILPNQTRAAFEGRVDGTTITALFDRGGDNIQVMFHLVHR